MPFPNPAGVFFFLLLILGYAGLSSIQPSTHVNDKFLHFISFLLLTTVFYWIVDTNRRRTLNLALVVCTFGLGVGSEFLQGFLPNGRQFDFYDIVANVVGSLAALGACSWYHQRMLERKRVRRQYNAVPGEDETDLELGEGSGHETGVVHSEEDGDGLGLGGEAPAPGRTLEEEVDNWDENALDDWDDGDADGDVGAAKGVETGDIGDTKRND